MKKINNDNNILYVCYYSDKKNNRNGSPAANTKLAYIFKKIKDFSKTFEVLSFSMVNNRSKVYKKYESYSTSIDKINIKFFSSHTSKYRLIRVLGRWLTWQEEKKYIKNVLKNNKDIKIIIYHSLELFKLYRLLKKMKINYTLEVEELYSDVLQNEKMRKKEIKYLQLANKYIFITEMLNKVVNIDNKPYIISHGTYKIEKEMEKIEFDKKKIRCVYAGTFDPRKGGVNAAISSAEYLPKNYHIHILGFGSDEQVSNIKNMIEETSKKTKAKVTYDGLLTGEDYIRFIQSCDIGLSTQNPDAAFNATSFPSKILSYMSNGLRVVSVRITAVETSDVGKYIYYYDKQTPKDIAKAIMNVNMNDDYDSRKIIKQLDKKFQKELEEILDE